MHLFSIGDILHVLTSLLVTGRFQRHLDPNQVDSVSVIPTAHSDSRGCWVKETGHR
jgi:hypothetical protein